jgi:cytochrome c-type biogenesis protein CcmH/NrfG
VADRAAALLETLDAAAYSATGTMRPDTAERVSSVIAEIETQAIPAGSSHASRAALALAFVAVLGICASALPPGLEQTFKAGVEAYDHAAFTSSQALFSRVAARAPRAPDAWANLGTAAWARGDSAGAVRGWQRALRLDPLDDEARARLERVQPPVMRTPGYVPPIPVNALAITALVVWIAAWLLLLVSPALRPLRARAYAGAAMTVSAVLLLGALELHDRLDARGLAVLRDTRLLLEAPGSTVAAASGVVGETGRIGAREGAWVRIALDNARAGWVPVASVLLMDAPPADD